MITTFAQALMEAEANAACGAEYGTPSTDGRTPATATGTASGTPRDGPIDVAIPEPRRGSYFPE